ncbi:hypothetical protein WA158_000534 [Blastocystis sp. Blastoise]
MENLLATPLTHEIVSTGFGFFKPEEVKKMSVKRIVSPVAFDADNKPVADGLYDPALGPNEFHQKCPTCLRSFEDCPGHMGHIELEVPVYNPILFPILLSLFKHECQFCHHFRINSAITRRVALQLKLINRGCLKEAMDLPTEMESANGNLRESSEERSERIESVFAKYEAKLAAAKTDSKDPKVYAHARRYYRELISSYVKNIPSQKCANCGCFSPSVRRDGYSKIFLRNLSKKNIRNNAARGRIVKPLLELSSLDYLNKVEGAEDIDMEAAEIDPEEDVDIGHILDKPNKLDISMKVQEELGLEDAIVGKDEDEIEEEEDIDTGAKYVPPLEVEFQLHELWTKEREIINLIYIPQVTSVGFMTDKDETDGYRVFFLRVLPVTPSRFRPPQHLHGEMFEHPQNVYLSKILRLNYQMMQLGVKDTLEGKQQLEGKDEYTIHKAIDDWIEMQDNVNAYIDSSKTRGGETSSGIRQLLEKKEGLFRMNMMGKRVNFAARSVIAPDPYIDTDEVGIPLRFAKELIYPEPVTSYNIAMLRQRVENGIEEYPGARYVEEEGGRLIDLSRRNRGQRKALAKTLLNKSINAQNKVKRVWRNLQDGDIVLVNRQPTLHKASIMALKTRILHSSRQTIRMHYSNCNTFNADFDGDEINIHFPQNEMARAEAYNIVCAKYQYVSAKDGSPLRGLIQDHVASGFLLTKRDTFLTREEYQQLLYVAIAGIDKGRTTAFVKIVPPCIYKPQPLWTGKQVITSILNHLIGSLPPINYTGKAKVGDKAWGEGKNVTGPQLGEQLVLVEDNELLRGVLDKSLYGATTYSLIHGIYEIYGADMASNTLSCFGRLFTYFLQKHGFTCTMDDLILNEKSEKQRRAIIDDSVNRAVNGLETFLELKDEMKDMTFEEKKARIRLEIRKKYISTNKEFGIDLDNAMKAIVSPISSEIIQVCLPHGLILNFPKNCFSCLVQSGAKGSIVNHSQVSCCLGQQELEGRRVPIMPSGKALPSFSPYDVLPRAGGFVSDRFLTGIRPQEYFFHCMAGREGLVDTAVKTSRSGYLQRCVIKHLEDLVVQYDYTVRNSEGNVIQFLYGDDGIDVSKSKYMEGTDSQLSFLARNYKTLMYKFGVYDNYFKDTGLDMENSVIKHEERRVVMKELEEEKACNEKGDIYLYKESSVIEARRLVNPNGEWRLGNISRDFVPAVIINIRNKNNIIKYDIVYSDDQTKCKKIPAVIFDSEYGVRIPIIRLRVPDPVNTQLNISRNVGAVSEQFEDQLVNYCKRNPEGILLDKETEKKKEEGKGEIEASGFKLLMWLKSMRSEIEPGEAVGVITGQSIGEPSTQMTLNTFHLAGHGAVNVTLGIPRLREIIMTASQAIKTPLMEIPLKADRQQIHAENIVRELHRLQLEELLDPHENFTVYEQIVKKDPLVPNSGYVRRYKVHMHLANIEDINRVHGINKETLLGFIKEGYLPNFCQAIIKELKKAKRGGNVYNLNSLFGAKDTSLNDQVKLSKNQQKDIVKPVADSEDDDDDDDEQEDNDEQGTLKFGSKKETAAYEDDDNYMEKSDEEEEKKEDNNNNSDSDSDNNDINELESDDETEEAKENKKQRLASRFQADLVTFKNKYPDVDISDIKTAKDLQMKIKEQDVTTFTKAKSTKHSTVSTAVDYSLLIADLPKGCEFIEPFGMCQRVKFYRRVYYYIPTNEVVIELDFPTNAPKILMLNLAEEVSEQLTVTSVQGIKNCNYLKPKSDANASDRYVVQCEGINFPVVWQFSEDVDVNHIQSNDIGAILHTYGVEAARYAIVHQINSVFAVYGISVDYRHLMLIADYMTQDGGFRPMNRQGLEYCDSPLLQMSYETTTHFLQNSSLYGYKDSMVSPSSRIATGEVIKSGTGACQIVQPLTVN